jgi:NAD(P)-dependent dehydrogenase (short-subunit alcohol dehydrogenase family)
MENYHGRVAVVTGAASGIGYSLAEKCVSYGMRVVLADIDTTALDQKGKALGESEGKCIAVPTNVANLSEVQTLALLAFKAFGRIDFLFINAGVNILARTWEYDILDWKWIIGVNLWGAIHCINAFLPSMQKQEIDSSIVFTASAGAFLAFQTAGPYNATKSAIVALAETLYNELKIEASKIRVHVLCPGMANTNIDKAEVHRPAEYKNPSIDYHDEDRLKYRIPRAAVEAGISPSRIADEVFNSIDRNEFYIFPQPEVKQTIAGKFQLIIDRNMTLDLSGAPRRD